MSHVLGVGSLGPVFLCVAGSGASLDLSSLFWLSARSVRVCWGVSQAGALFCCAMAPDSLSNWEQLELLAKIVSALLFDFSDLSLVSSYCIFTLLIYFDIIYT